jgi:hypothetical protein
MKLAYLDVISGLIPCRVISWTPYRHDYTNGQFGSGFWVQYTATRGAYMRGAIEWWSVSAIVPRRAVVTRNGRYVVKPYSWPETAPELFNPAGAAK